MHPFTLNCRDSDTCLLTLDHYGWKALADALSDDPLHGYLQSCAEPSDAWFEDGMSKRLTTILDAADAFRLFDALRTLDN